jgi:hypothetical protein
MTDIRKQAVKDTATMHVKGVDGELLYTDDNKPVQIVVYGPGSKAYGLVESRQSSRAVKRMQDNDGKISIAPFEERQRETAEDLAALTVRFENLDYSTEQKLEGTELYTAVYADPSLGFIAKQVAKFVADWGNFKAA